jgi:uncharacterized membrane protein (DUF4010 family)
MDTFERFQRFSVALAIGLLIGAKREGDERGLLITGIAGGLVSSTAVTVTLARIAHDQPTQKNIATAGALAAGTTMMARVAAVIGVFNIKLMLALLPALTAAAAVIAIGAYVLVKRQHQKTEKPSGALQLTNPFELATVLKFGALLAVIMILANYAKITAGTSGLFRLAAISGIGDVDAITLSMSLQAGADVAIAVAINTLSNAVIAWLA